MLKVLIVDDEPVISQGLMVLLDWEEEGYEIVKIAGNGQEALDYLRENQVDLILADIKMPVMNGIELLRHLYEEEISDAARIILSGFNDFAYAQNALRYGCMDYLLKPVKKEDLLQVLRRINNISETARQEKESRRQMEEDYLRSTMKSLLFGSVAEKDVEYIASKIQMSGDVRFISISLNQRNEEEESETEINQRYRKLYEVCCDYLKNDADKCIDIISQEEKDSEVGLILAGSMLEASGQSEEAYLMHLQQYITAVLETEVCLFVGKKVPGLSRLSQSYGTVRMLKPLEGFQIHKSIYYYEKEMQVRQSGMVICKDQLDQLIQKIVQNNPVEIKNGVNSLFAEMEKHGMNTDIIRLNTNYLLFSLIHLATEQDGDVDQDKVIHYISDSSFTDGAMRGSSTHLQRFCCEYAEYLDQLRKEDSKGILQDIEKEIRNNYSSNLTLKDLGKKFYLNSSYLGQLFRKKYGMSFKDYLNQYRINEAARLLMMTDKKVSDISEAIGYKDHDYFIRKFIEIKGCTPTKYRQNKNIL